MIGDYRESNLIISYAFIAKVLAFLFVLVWSIETYVDLAVARWLIIALLVSFVFLFLRSNFRFPRLQGLILLSFALAPSVVFSDDPVYSVAQFLRFFSILLFCVFVGALMESSRYKVLWFAVYCVIGLTLLSTFLYPLLSDGAVNNSFHRVRYSGVFYHENITGFCSGITVLFSVHQYIYNKHNFNKRLIAVFIFSCGLLTLVLSDSRTAFVAVVIGVFVLWSSFHKNKFSLGLVAGILIVLSFIPLYVSVATGNINLDDSAHNASIIERLLIWGDALEKFNASLFIGEGFGLRFYTGEISWDGNPIYYPYAHNIILNSLAFSGLSSLFYLLVVFSILIRASQCNFTSAKQSFARSVIYFIFACSIFDGALQGLWLSHILFFLSAAAIGGLWNRFTMDIPKSKTAQSTDFEFAN